MEYRIESGERLMEQAGMTAATYMRAGVDAIDREFGPGFAAANPALLAAFMAAAAGDYHTGAMKMAAQDIRDVLQAVADAVVDMAPR
jgi:hypothetical protein